MEALLVLLGIAFAAVLVIAFFFTVGARKQIDTYAKAPYNHVIDVVRDHFGSVWWRAVDGPGDLNFQARGFGLASVGNDKPVLSVTVTQMDNGNVSVAVWMSSWSQRMGIAGCCDRVYLKRRKLIQKIDAL
ncbi:hypothetical protein IU487_17350 [Nocardia puris]|uniref:Uncharacterized protein n=1 Tax=Nocardia puris TaxID=208602 RepID=A0A366E1Y8_9NOCA|nr:hypothetical protein [Nocardia puris]MBF6212797.1 hypothetical protein [Nocardia puris]RBO96380.1 hypothetical protein DFR74_101395 [Nocardia puris]